MLHTAIRASTRTFLAVALAAHTASAQEHPSWTADGADSTGAKLIVVDDAAFTYVVETVGAPTAVPAAIRTTKRAPDGSVAWTRDFQSTADDFARSSAVDTDGSVYVAGVADYTLTPTPPLADSKLLLLKYSAAGALEWSITPHAGGAFAVAVDRAGAVYVAGEEFPGTSTSRFVRRYSSAGTVVWTVPISGASRMSLEIPSPTRLFVGGFPGSVFRLDPATGATLWSRALDFGPQSIDALAAIAADAAGNVAVASVCFANLQSATRWGVGLYDEQGNLRWQRQLSDGPLINHKIVRDVALDPTGRVVVLGTFQYNAARSYDLVTAVWDAAGDLAWFHPYVSDSLDDARSLAIDEAGNVLVVGVRATDAPQSQGIGLRYDPAGNAIWLLVDPDPSVPESAAFDGVATRDGSFTLAGSRRGVGTTRSYFARYDPANTAFCFGDGSATACPCGNASAPSERAGCASSLGLGARLDFVGTSSLSYDSIALVASRMTGTTALFFQGTALEVGGAGVVFGDGLRCAGGSVMRLGVQAVGGGAASYPEAGDARVSVRGAVVSPGSRTYQTWYRNAASFCTSATFNLSNGLAIVWRI